MLAKVCVLVTGVVILIIGIVVQAHYGPIDAACNSPLGRTAQGFAQFGGSASSVPNCGEASAGNEAGWLLIVVGSLATLSGIVTIIRSLVTTMPGKAGS